MNDPLALSKVVALCLKLGWQEAIKRLESVQGPEQGLVGESRSGSPTGPAEEAKPGERGVAEIAELAELKRHVEEVLKKARRLKISHERWHHTVLTTYYSGKQDALADLLEHIENMAEKRSDLCNADVLAPAGEKTPTTKKDV